MKLLQVTSLSALLLSATTSWGVAAKNQTDDERWFEMEVIIFNQLADKDQLKEAFPDQIPLPKYRRVIDLLSPYLNPDIAALKQLLPHCDDPQYPPSLLEQASKPAPYFSPKDLADIEKLPSENVDMMNTDLESASQFEQSVDQENNEQPLTQSGFTDNNPTQNTTTDDTSNEQMLDSGDSHISAAEQQLISLAEQAFSRDQFIYSQSDKMTIGHQNLCRIDETYFDELNQDNQYSYNGFSVSQMPRNIDATEDVYSDKPYLLSQDSLQLHDIVKQLSRSKNFRPLLHVGWRQAPKGRNQAIPVRLMAGDNLALHYQNAQKQYQDALKISQQQELLMAQLLSANNEPADIGSTPLPSNDFINTEDHTAVSAELAASLAEQQAQEKQALLQEKIDDILQKIKNLSDDNAELLAQLDSAALPVASQNEQQVPTNLMLTPEPVEPVQPWYLDGFFKVHLNHYLYITADFNIMNMTLAEQATKALQTEQAVELKPIRFAQNRRVISGEIHYFDHPYMGMIVQIRRHERPEPEPEPESVETELTEAAKQVQ
ncbi:CsiV family protein [Colwelliaceae bacterium 6471]